MVVGPPMTDCTGEQNGGSVSVLPDHPLSLTVMMLIDVA
jgi:hypothetical protein